MPFEPNGDGDRLERVEALLFLTLALLASAPLWLVRYPPLQDLPDHLATIRVLHSFHDPAFGFDRELTASFRETPYMAYYFVVDALAYLFGVRGANVVVMSASMAGIPLALRAFLRRTGRDPRAALLAIPLLYNSMWMLGLLPFTAGMALFFAALAAAAVHVEELSRRSAIVFGAVTALLLVTHLIPFALFGLAFATLLPWRDLRRAVRVALPTVPALVLLAWYTAFTQTGEVLRQGEPAPAPPAAAILGRAYSWTTNVLSGSADEYVFIAFALLVFAAFALGAPRRSARVGRFFFLVPMACFLLMFLTPDGHGGIMLLSQRFPILLLYALVPCVPWPSERRLGIGFTAAAGAIAIASIVTVSASFIRVEARELGDFDGALAAMEPRKHVAGLIFDANSSIVRSVAFVQFVSYYQLEKGGVVEYSSFGKVHNPIGFQQGREPPTGAPPALDLIPTHIRMDQLYPYFDYVLVRGEGFHPPAGTFRLTWQGERWAVWSREREHEPG
jgi:hypothetical protein